MVASKGTFLLLNLDYFVAYIKMFFFRETDNIQPQWRDYWMGGI